MDRRQFLGGGVVVAGGGAFCSAASAAGAEAGANPSGVGGYNYRLPGFEKRARLLFQGDSITDMNRGRDERDRNHYLGHGYVYLIAARLGVEMAEAGLDFRNRGVSGHTVADLRKRWSADALELAPDLLSVLVGVNDVDRAVRPDAYESDYRYLLSASRERNPRLRLVLLDPFVLRSGRLKEERAWASHRAAIDELRAVVARLAEEFNAVHIRTQDVFDAAAEAANAEQWVWDGVHPLPQGHELIARSWLEAVSARWPRG